MRTRDRSGLDDRGDPSRRRLNPTSRASVAGLCSVESWGFGEGCTVSVIDHEVDGHLDNARIRAAVWTYAVCEV